LRRPILIICLAFQGTPSSSKPLCNIIDDGKGNSQLLTDVSPLALVPNDKSSYLLSPKFPCLSPVKSDTTKLAPLRPTPVAKSIDNLHLRNSLAKNVLGHFITSEHTNISHTGVKSISYFEQFSGKRIVSVRFVSLRPFGTSLFDTTLTATKLIAKFGNRLHRNTDWNKLRTQVLFKAGDLVNPILMAENEKLMRDLSYLEDVAFSIEPVLGSTEDVILVVLSKDKFEYGVNASFNADNSNLEVVNENMFGLGHRFSIGMAQKNDYLPELGFYSSYYIDNFLGRFINARIGFSDTYFKKGWNLSAEKKFLTSVDKNAGGLSFDYVSKFNYIADDHPIELDTTVAFVTGDLWFSHAFSNKNNLLNKTLISFRYYHQEFMRKNEETLGENMFLRDHDFFLAGLGFSRRNLYKNNLVYGYGVTEDIPYGHFYELTGGLDRSQFGIWPYMGLSISNAFIGNEGSYYSGKLSLDGFLDRGSVVQGTFQVSGNFFSKKMYAFGDPFRQFVDIEFLSGINRFKEEYLNIDGRFGIRDFYASDLKGNCRLRVKLEMVRYLNWNLYGFRFTNYFFSDIAFLSDQPKSIFKEDFYAGVGAGFRIFNESLVFKIIDIRLTWFPVKPPEGRIPFGANLQGLTKSIFDDFLGRKSEIIRYQ